MTGEHLDLPQVSPWVAAALLNTCVPQAEDVLEQLFDAQLIDIAEHVSAGYTRYRPHAWYGCAPQNTPNRRPAAGAGPPTDRSRPSKPSQGWQRPLSFRCRFDVAAPTTPTGS
jgi:hypothetical protein